MKRRALLILFLCMAMLAVIPLATASAAYSSQITGQGELIVSGSFTAGIPNEGVSAECDVYVVNQNGQTVYSQNFIGWGGAGSIHASVPNLPSGTYTVSLAGPRLSVTNLQIYFK
ncbi:hypothetical protein [Paenibacillus tyrfis]|uniref:hypothetical protein n=1 Tax=Paenibacillus tyrfis TaxID=1501230 RepID=UPI0020A0BE35|nr:hypothetical protein [Paenibacillus tyrfis]MCP1309625.1 hypothetical protein [Paenibacillus tyrfis]